MANDETREAVELSAAELQGPGVIFCPNPRMPLWSNHPRVFIDVASAGVGKCPYCGTEYRLKAGEKSTRTDAGASATARSTHARMAAIDADSPALTRSLVIAPQWIGDAVMAEPLLATLAERGEQLTVAALPWVAPVFRAMPEVAEIVALPFAHGRLDWAARRRVAATLRDRFEVAYVLPNSIKSALLPRLAGVPTRVGYSGEGRRLLLNRRLRNPAGRPPMVAFYGALAGKDFDRTRTPRLQLDAATADAALQKAAVARDAYWVFAPGAEYGPAKRWPPAHYAALARSLHAADGAPVVLLGSPSEAELCEAIAAAAPGACRVLAGRTSLLEAMALIASARGLASNDSGLMHVAAAFGVPQVAVFGSTSPAHTPPLNPRARVLWLKEELQLDCMPCFARSCRYGHTQCLVGVAPERVEAALRDATRGAAADERYSENLPA